MPKPYTAREMREMAASYNTPSSKDCGRDHYETVGCSDCIYGEDCKSQSEVVAMLRQAADMMERVEKTIRNCDRFATGEAEKAFSEFEAFCDAHSCRGCPIGKVDGPYSLCTAAWLLAPHEAESEATHGE